MIDYDSLPAHFNNECVTALQIVNREIKGDTNDGWFRVEYDSSNGPELVAYFNLDHSRSSDISNSPVLTSQVATVLLAYCPVSRFTIYGHDGYHTEYDIWNGYKVVNGALVEMSICETDTYPLFCDDL
ncbi:MAG: hypothetical protein KME14_10750 [Tildeniella torsiva UHER 1998/13D]|jgi:hypothetical protein|nr:hypothetical protein [Tildeniella torsiva UHER 1998/13D]